MAKFIIKSAVIGDPIAHSSSPKIHNFLLQKYQISGSYEAIKVEKAELKNAVKSFIEKGFAGFNVTIPHKEEIYQICDFRSKTAILTKAVNTVVITSEGKIFGHNSDAEGFLNNLKYSQNNFDYKGKNAFVIGAGGAARAIIYSLIKAGFGKIIISNRNEERANELIKDLSWFAEQNSCKLCFLQKSYFEKSLFDCDILINSTSLGMDNQPKLEINIDVLRPDAVVYDIVYKPLMTDLLLAAQKRGNKIVTGIGMLVFQALIGFELWFKRKPEEADISEILKNISLKS